jgi:hypothetical protein
VQAKKAPLRPCTRRITPPTATGAGPLQRVLGDAGDEGPDICRAGGEQLTPASSNLGAAGQVVVDQHHPAASQVPTRPESSVVDGAPLVAIEFDLLRAGPHRLQGPAVLASAKALADQRPRRLEAVELDAGHRRHRDHEVGLRARHVDSLVRLVPVAAPS